MTCLTKVIPWTKTIQICMARIRNYSKNRQVYFSLKGELGDQRSVQSGGEFGEMMPQRNAMVQFTI